MQKILFKNRSPRTMLVDDSPVNSRFLWTILQESGCEIFAAQDGAQALQLALEKRPDLVLMDVNMPGMNGFEVCRALKAEPTLKSTPVIFLTARDDKDDIVKGFEAGAVDYVVKPFHIRELLARVSTQLELKQLRDDLADAVAELRNRNEKLQSSLDHVARLEHAMLKICAWTKQVNVEGKWITIEEYLSHYLGLVLTHGVSESAKISWKKDAGLA
jgi:phosphoserine phosphatase RsbU/P